MTPWLHRAAGGRSSISGRRERPSAGVRPQPNLANIPPVVVGVRSAGLPFGRSVLRVELPDWRGAATGGLNGSLINATIVKA